MEFCPCGQQASTSCYHLLCGRCCHGCDRHRHRDGCSVVVDQYEQADEVSDESVWPGLMCECGNLAAQACSNQCCRRCCYGPCDLHGEPLPAAAPPPPDPVQQQGHWCECGQPAAQACTQWRCASCCCDRLCVRHEHVPLPSDASEHYDEDRVTSEEEEHVQAQYLCVCGQPAAQACAMGRCGRCCCDNNCARHTGAPPPAQDPFPYPGQQQTSEEEDVCELCSCGQPAAQSCTMHRCGRCCSDNRCHRHAGVPLPARTALPNASGQPPSAAAADVCCCGQPAAQTCTQRRCGRCCRDTSCPRHADVALPGRTFLPYSRGSEVLTADGFDDSNMLYASAMDVIADMMRVSFATFSAASQPPQAAAADGGGGGGAGGGAAARAPTGSGIEEISGMFRDINLGAHSSSHTSRAGAAAGRSSGGSATTGAGASSSGAAAAGQAVSSSSFSSQAAAGQRSSAGAAGPSNRLLVGGGAYHNPSSSGQAAGDVRGCRAGRQSDQGRAASAGGCAGHTCDDTGSSRGHADGSPEEMLVQLKSCVVCLDAPRSVVLLPCKHLAMCDGCSDQLVVHAREQFVLGVSSSLQVLCPVCRAPAEQRLHGVIMS